MTLETHAAAPAAPDDRELVTVQTISALTPIPGADLIEAATVRGWTVVVRKGDFAVGDPVLYFEIDSLLPLNDAGGGDSRFAFLAPRGEKVVDGVRYHRLKTAKLRGVYSQGLVLPTADFTAELAGGTAALAGQLGVVKYEPPLPTSGMGQAIGVFPTHLGRKTDSERAQNLTDVWDAIRAAGPWLASEKVDGTSFSGFHDPDGTLRVCGRNWEIADGDNVYWNAARDHGILDALAGEPAGDGVQMEVYGEGIQANSLRVKGVRVAVFSYLRAGRPLPRRDWPAWALALATPVYEELSVPATVAEAVSQVDGIKSLISPGRLAEGVVWHQVDGVGLPELDGRATWKCISNRWLLKTDS